MRTFVDDNLASGWLPQPRPSPLAGAYGQYGQARLSFTALVAPWFVIACVAAAIGNPYRNARAALALSPPYCRAMPVSRMPALRARSWAIW
jgi:hypothetical protein